MTYLFAGHLLTDKDIMYILNHIRKEQLKYGMSTYMYERVSKYFADCPDLTMKQGEFGYPDLEPVCLHYTVGDKNIYIIQFDDKLYLTMEYYKHDICPKVLSGEVELLNMVYDMFNYRIYSV